MTNQTVEQQQADKSTLETLNKQIQEQFKVDIDSAPDDPTLKDEEGNIKTGETGAELEALIDKTVTEPEPPEVTPDKTAELEKQLAQAVKDRAAFQGFYQTALKKLEQLNPANYAQVKSEIRQESKTQLGDSSQQTATDIQDDYLTVSAAKKIFSDVLSETLNKHQEKATVDAQLQAVDNYCGQIVTEFRQQNNISEEQVQTALKEVAAYGIDAKTPAGMKGLTRALLDKLTLQAVDSTYNIEVTKAAEDAAGKAKDLKKVQQPAASPLPTPQKTRNQKVLDLMKDPKKEALDEFFGKK